jgi:diguanylate cyclase (GGDEF)-like protein
VDTAGILKRTFRSSDIVARLGGDEFAGLVIATSPNAGGILLERLQEAFNGHNLQSDKPYKLSISFGMTEYDPGSPATLEELLEEGDRVMYEQKKMKKMARTA